MAHVARRVGVQFRAGWCGVSCSRSASSVAVPVWRSGPSAQFRAPQVSSFVLTLGLERSGPSLAARPGLQLGTRLEL